MKHKACRRMAPVLQAREMASIDLHTAEVADRRRSVCSIPVSPTSCPVEHLGAVVLGAPSRVVSGSCQLARGPRRRGPQPLADAFESMT
jgi:hypothetical protein